MRNDELEKTLFDAEGALHSPEVRHSVERLEQLLHEDFVEFGASGRVYRHADIVRELPGETDDGSRIEMTDFSMQQLGTYLALVTYRSHRRDADGNVRVALRSSLWFKGDAAWRIVFHQGTPVPA